MRPFAMTRAQLSSASGFHVSGFCEWLVSLHSTPEMPKYLLDNRQSRSLLNQRLRSIPSRIGISHFAKSEDHSPSCSQSPIFRNPPMSNQRSSLSCDPTVHVPPSRSRNFATRHFGMVLSFEPSVPEMSKCRCFGSMAHSLTRSNRLRVFSRFHVS
jgi:hypothetical protein